MNHTTSTSPYDDNGPQMHVLSALAILGIILNIIQIKIIAKKEKKAGWKQTATFFILSLSIADLQTGLFVAGNNFALSFWKVRLWKIVWGQVTCHSLMNSFLHVVALTLDRLYAVIKPLKRMTFMTRSRTIKMVSFVWIASFSSFFNLLNAKVFMMFKCSLFISTGVLLAIVYVIIFRKIRKIVAFQRLSVGKSVAESLNSSVEGVQQKLDKREMRSAIYCAMIVVAFLGCSYPLAINTFLGNQDKKDLRSFIIYSMMVVNSVCNPALFLIKETCFDE